jgi:hypothetical protein
LTTRRALGQPLDLRDAGDDRGGRPCATSSRDRATRTLTPSPASSKPSALLREQAFWLVAPQAIGRDDGTGGVGRAQRSETAHRRRRSRPAPRSANRSSRTARSAHGEDRRPRYPLARCVGAGSS